MAHRREAAQELRKRRAVFAKAGPGRRVGADEGVRRIGEEPLMHDRAHHREIRLQGFGQRGEDVVPMDAQARLGVGAFAENCGNDLSAARAQDREPDPVLNLMQHRHP